MNEEWYNERDKRTDAFTNGKSGYKNSTVHVIVTDDIGEVRVQLTTFFTVTVLARWCQKIVFTSKESNVLLKNGKGSFDKFISDLVVNIDPLCKFRTADFDSLDGDIRLYIGKAFMEEKGEFVSITGGGWLAGCGINKGVSLNVLSTPLDAIGCGFAACLGNAAIFRYLIGHKESSSTKWYSLLDNVVFDSMPSSMPEIPELKKLDLGRMHIIGCGAIGSSFVFLMPYLPVSGKILLVDSDYVKIHNTSSSMLFTADDAIKKKFKVDLCNDYLERNEIIATIFQDDYQAFDYGYNKTDLSSPDVILCFANENNIWATIQNQFPPLCFHATTSKSWGVNIGRHIPLKENCLMCTFKDFVEVRSTSICGDVALPNMKKDSKANNSQFGEKDQDDSSTAILPFLAPAAALITVSELIKILLDKNGHNNTTIFNMASSNGDFVMDYGSFGQCFICSKQEELYNRFGPHSKFWHLSLD